MGSNSRGVCECVSNGKWGRMMLRVQPCGEWEEGRGLGPPQEQGREVVSGGLPKVTPPQHLRCARLHNFEGECWFRDLLGCQGALAAPCCG